MTDIDTATRIAVESVRAVTDAYGPELAAKDAEITRLRALVEEMGKACGPLVEACYEEMHGDECADEPDDEPVATGFTTTGQPYNSPVTFGMIRRARATLAKAKEQS